MKTFNRLLILCMTALILNIIWEFSHYRLYLDLSGIPTYPHLFLASITDMLIVLGIVIIISLINKGLKWINKPNKNDYFFVIGLGLIIAFIIEVINLNLGRWEYTDAMPIIFSVGLSPLVQIAVTGVLSIILARIFIKN